MLITKLTQKKTSIKSIKGILKFIIILCLCYDSKISPYIEEISNTVKNLKKSRCPSISLIASDWRKILAQIIAGGSRASECSNPNIRMSLLEWLSTSQWDNQIDKTPYQKLVSEEYDDYLLDFNSIPIAKTYWYLKSKENPVYNYEFYIQILNEPNMINRINYIDQITYDLVSNKISSKEIHSLMKILYMLLNNSVLIEVWCFELA